MADKDKDDVKKSVVAKDNKVNFDSFVSTIKVAYRYSFNIFAKEKKKDVLNKRMSRAEWQKILDEFLKREV